MYGIAAIVVTYNRKELLQTCVECVLAQEGAVCDILIIDNASTDGTHEAIEPFLGGRVRYFNTGENTGGAGGFNFGIKKALEAGYDLLWLMDDDTQPCPNALAELLAAGTALKGEYGFLSSTAFWTDGTVCRMNRQKVCKGRRKSKTPEAQGVVPISQATFVSFMISAAGVRRFGLPIKEFFIWGDDIEYTRRIAVRGGETGYLAVQSRVVHAMKSNTGSNIAVDTTERLWQYAYAYRNECYFYRKEGFLGVCHYLARCTRDLFRILLFARGQRAKRLGVLFSAVWRGLSFRPQVEFVPECKPPEETR